MHNNIPFFIFSLLLLIAFSGAYASNVYDTETGWNWYEKEKVESTNEKENTRSVTIDPVEEIKALRYSLQKALDEALLSPTKENVIKYVVLQKQMADKAGAFEKTWKEVLLERPDLDFSLVHPADNLARKVEIEENNRLENKAIAFFAQRSGFFFFYKSNCPYCHAFAPILRRFTDQYKLEVIAISLDGGILPDFPNSYKDQGQSRVFNVKATPALYIVNPYTKEGIPFSFGLLSESDLKRRFLEIARGLEKTK